MVIQPKGKTPPWAKGIVAFGASCDSHTKWEVSGRQLLEKGGGGKGGTLSRKKTRGWVAGGHRRGLQLISD